MCFGLDGVGTPQRIVFWGGNGTGFHRVFGAEILTPPKINMKPKIKGQLGVPLMYVYPWYLLCSRGILGD